MAEIAAPDSALFGALFEQSAAGVAVFSIGGRFLRASPALCRMLGYTEPELLQKTHLDVIHLEDLDALTTAIAIWRGVTAHVGIRRHDAPSRPQPRYPQGTGPGSLPNVLSV